MPHRDQSRRPHPLAEALPSLFILLAGTLAAAFFHAGVALATLALILAGLGIVLALRAARSASTSLRPGGHPLPA